jgi:hypothetical protein
MTGLFIIAHAPLASALREAALHTFPEAALDVAVFDVPATASAESALADASAISWACTPARLPSSPSWPAASQRGAHVAQRPPRQCQEHHGRDDAGRRHGQRVEIETTAPTSRLPWQALLALIDDKFGEGE